MFEKHVFVCTSGAHCPGKGSQAIRDELKRLMKSDGLSDHMRINNCGCLGQCEAGPNLVIYPDGVWYSGVNLQDVPEIYGSLKTGRRIARLLNDQHHPGERTPR